MAIELIPLEETHVEPTTEAQAATADVVPPDAPPAEPKKRKGTTARQQKQIEA